MSKLRLGVVFGGQSSEYSVSLHSVASFLRQIHADNYDMTLIGINKNGHFYLYNGEVDSIEHDTWENEKSCVSCAWVNGGIMPLDGSNKVIKLDCVFPVLHGKNGEDGLIQGLLELMNIHYVGCDVMSSAMSNGWKEEIQSFSQFPTYLLFHPMYLASTGNIGKSSPSDSRMNHSAFDDKHHCRYAPVGSFYILKDGRV